MRLTIEPAAADQLEEISALAAVIWRAHYPGIISHEQIDYMLARMYDVETMRRELAIGVAWFRALTEGKLSGFASVGPSDHPGEFKLHKLYVHPNCQRLGLGRALLAACESAARANGARTLMLNVNKANAGAINVYRKSGFTVRNSIVADIGGGFVMDDFVMSKSM